MKSFAYVLVLLVSFFESKSCFADVGIPGVTGEYVGSSKHGSTCKAFLRREYDDFVITLEVNDKYWLTTQVGMASFEKELSSNPRLVRMSIQERDFFDNVTDNSGFYLRFNEAGELIAAGVEDNGGSIDCKSFSKLP